MHELSLVRSLLDIVDEYDRREGFAKVKSLKLSCGHLSCIDPNAFKFVFAVQAEGTKAEGAELVFDILPAVLYCLACEKEFPSQAFRSECPGCGSSDILLTGGTEELQLLEMEID